MPTLGILFDIEQLGGGLYGYAAYKILFGAIDKYALADCEISDGDTSSTLEGRANHYCIAITSPDSSKLALIKRELSACDAKGLLSPESRFVEDERVASEPLVHAGRFTTNGELIGCTTGWVREAWLKRMET